MSSERSGSARNPGRRSNTPSSLGAGGPRHAACACRRGPHPGPLAFALCFPVLGGFGAPPLSGGFGRRLHCGAVRISTGTASHDLSPAASAVGFIAGGRRCASRCAWSRSPAASAVGFIAGHPRHRRWGYPCEPLRRLRPSASLRVAAPSTTAGCYLCSPAASAVGFIAGS